MSNDDDRRESVRAPIELKVEYKKLNTFFADYTKNICKGGTFIRTKKPLDVGTVFVFRLTVPKLKEPIGQGAVQRPPRRRQRVSGDGLLDREHGEHDAGRGERIGHRVAPARRRGHQPLFLSLPMSFE